MESKKCAECGCEFIKSYALTPNICMNCVDNMSNQIQGSENMNSDEIVEIYQQKRNGVNEMSSVQRFEYIQQKLAESKQTGNNKAVKSWRNKLTKWQQEYGAYAPINYTKSVSEL